MSAKTVRPMLAFFLFPFISLHGQKSWDLKSCVEYALQNNILIKQAGVQAKVSELSYQQARASQLPSINSGLSSFYNFGLSENPTTGVLENRKSFGSTVSIQSTVTLFNWFSLRNAAASSRLASEAENEQLTKIKSDVSWNILVAYLQILLAEEQEKLSAIQIQQTEAHLVSTKKQVLAGILPELNRVELEAQLALDSSSHISNQLLVAQLLIQLKFMLGLDGPEPFDIVTFSMEHFSIPNFSDLQPEAVYHLAIANMPGQRVNQTRLKSALKASVALKGQMMPLVSAFAGLNSRYAYSRLPLYARVVSGYEPSGYRVNAGGGIFYPVESPIISQTRTGKYFSTDPLFEQLWRNFGQGLGISVQFSLFNGHRSRLNYQKGLLSVRQVELQNQQDQALLKQEVYKAFNEALAAYQRYSAITNGVVASEKAYQYAQKRYSLNLLSAYDLITSANRLLRTRVEAISAQYEYIFKLKMLEYYKSGTVIIE